MKWLYVLFVVLIPIILILGSARLVVFNRGLHSKLFVKTNVPFENAVELNDDVIDFLKGHKDVVEADVFSDREKDHLKDVKTLIDILLLVWYGCIAVFGFLLYYFSKKVKIVKKGLYHGGLLTLGVLGVGVLLFLINFDFAFSLFHKIFFPQGNYVFRTNLPMLYNAGWYFSISFRIVLYSVIGAGVLVAQKLFK